MHKWRIITHGKLSPAENMAIDESILINVSQGKSLPVLRFYDWEPASVSGGFNQDVEKEINLKKVQEYGFGFVRRPTGGRMVLHRDEVTYSVISDLSGFLSGNITETYSKISEAIAAGLVALGINAEFERNTLSVEHQRQQGNPCFGSASKYEIKCNNKKLVGSAQVRKENTLLQHGSILLNYNQELMAELIPGLSESEISRLKKILTKKTVAVNQLIEKQVDFSEAVEKIISGFQTTWNEIDFFVDNLTLNEQKVAEDLKIYKYDTDAWNYHKKIDK